MHEDGESLELSDECFGEFLEVIHRLTGITIAQNRKSMVQGRIGRRTRVLGLAGYEDYLNLVRTSKEEEPRFIDLITTNETQFFRTPRIWEYLERVFMPQWFSANPGKTFHCWSAAASSGEEAHSLGILCYRFLSTHAGFDFSITGTDISEEMIHRCEEGIYHGRSIESFSATKPTDFSLYMEVAGGGYRVIQDIRRKIQFKQHNLFNRFNPASRFDLILLRNVLIYFTGKDQEKVLENLAPLLSDTGILIIGESESLAYIKTSFESIEPLIYRKVARESTPSIPL